MKLYEINEIEINKKEIVRRIKNYTDLMDIAYAMFEGSEKEWGNKQKIIKLFKDKKKSLEEHLKEIRTLYSTRTSNKGIEDLVEKIYEVSGNKTNIGDIRQRFIDFFVGHADAKDDDSRKEFCEFRRCKSECECFCICRCGGNREICELIYRKYMRNYNKKNEKYDRRIEVSLITKYAYFLTEQKFPIYDSFVRKICRILSQKESVSLAQIRDMKIPDMSHNFFEVMHAVSNEIGDNEIGTGVDRFDAFCWTWGKIAIDREEANNIFGKGRVDNFVLKLREARLLTK